MEERNIKIGDMVMISGELTGCGAMRGYVINIEKFFGRDLYYVRYDAASLMKVKGPKDVSGYEEHFAKVDSII